MAYVWTSEDNSLKSLFSFCHGDFAQVARPLSYLSDLRLPFKNVIFSCVPVFILTGTLDAS